jgi:hypothetical protein
VALYIYRVERPFSARKSFYKPNLSGLLNLAWNQGARVRPVMGTGQTGALGVQILQKSYLPHLDSDLDIPHMKLDLLDETYSMVMPKLYFVDIDHTGLTGGTHRSDRSNQTCQFWVRTVRSHMSWSNISGGLGRRERGPLSQMGCSLMCFKFQLIGWYPNKSTKPCCLT